MDLQTGFIGSFLSFLLAVGRVIQSKLSLLFSWSCINPALCFAKLLNAERNLPSEQRRTESKTFVVLDCLKPSHKLLWKYLKFAFQINGYISGFVGRHRFYGRLLQWNKQIPLIGYVEDKTTFTIELLFDYSKEKGRENWRNCDFTWLSTHKRHGTFQVLSKNVLAKNNGEEIIVKCIWTSGKDEGKTFEIKRLPDLRNQSEDVSPSAIYYPPRFIVFGFEGLISAGIILTMLQLTKDGWHLLQSPAETLTSWLSMLFQRLF